MAKVTELVILNSSDKTRQYSVASGKGAIVENDDVIVTDVATYPLGSQFSDLTNKVFYVRFGAAKVASDWVAINSPES